VRLNRAQSKRLTTAFGRATRMSDVCKMSPSDVRCDAQSDEAGQSDYSASLQPEYDQAAQDLCTRYPSQGEAGWITQVAVSVRVSRERGKGESNSKCSIAVFWLLLACVAVKYHAPHWTGGLNTLQEIQRSRPKARPFSFESEAGGV
jgi:hypothetical protein